MESVTKTVDDLEIINTKIFDKSSEINYDITNILELKNNNKDILFSDDINALITNKDKINNLMSLSLLLIRTFTSNTDKVYKKEYIINLPNTRNNIKLFYNKSKKIFEIKNNLLFIIDIIKNIKADVLELSKSIYTKNIDLTLKIIKSDKSKVLNNLNVQIDNTWEYAYQRKPNKIYAKINYLSYSLKIKEIDYETKQIEYLKNNNQDTLLDSTKNYYEKIYNLDSKKSKNIILGNDNSLKIWNINIIKQNFKKINDSSMIGCNFGYLKEIDPQNNLNKFYNNLQKNENEFQKYTNHDFINYCFNECSNLKNINLFIVDYLDENVNSKYKSYNNFIVKNNNPNFIFKFNDILEKTKWFLIFKDIYYFINHLELNKIKLFAKVNNNIKNNEYSLSLTRRSRFSI